MSLKKNTVPYIQPYPCLVVQSWKFHCLRNGPPAPFVKCRIQCFYIP